MRNGFANSGDVAGDLLPLEHDELDTLEWCEADQDVHQAEVDVVLRDGLVATLDEVRLARRAPPEGALIQSRLPLDPARGMSNITNTSIAILFAGLLLLVFGYSRSNRGYGPLMIGAGVACLLAVIVYYIFQTLRASP